MITAQFNTAKKTMLWGVVTTTFTATVLFSGAGVTLATTYPCTAGPDSLCAEEEGQMPLAPRAATPLGTVWGYSGRTMINLGGLTGEVVGYARTIVSKFGSLAFAVWHHSSRSDPAQSTTGTVAGARTPEVQSSQEQLVNTPSIQPLTQEKPIDLADKIRSSLAIADGLQIHHHYIYSKIGVMDLKQDTLTAADITQRVAEIDKVLGDESDISSTDTLFGTIAWLRSSWDWVLLDDMYNQAQAIKAVIRSIQVSAPQDRAAGMYEEIESLAGYAKTLDILIGNATHIDGEETVFGKLNNLKDLSDIFTASDEEIDTLLTQWSARKGPHIPNQADAIIDTVLTHNQIPQAEAIVQASTNRSSVSEQDNAKNEMLSLKGLIQANTILLANGSNAAVTTTWLEFGSIVFKSLITNPSTVSQEVSLTYYLPPELTKEDIVQTSEGLSVTTDTEKNQLFTNGTFVLNANDSKTVEVRVRDKWTVTPAQIDLLRRQTEDLFHPLEKTAYFAQGIAVKSDITASLDTVLARESAVGTPDQKIRNFRQSVIDLNGVQSKLDTLKDLVTRTGSLSSAGAVLGALTGTHTLPFWGLLIAAAAGCAVLVVCLRFIISSHAAVKVVYRRMVLHSVAFLAFGLLTAVVSGITVGWSMSRHFAAGNDTNRVPIAAQEAEPPNTIEVMRIVAPPDTMINLRQGPSTKAAIVYTLADQEPVVKLEENGQWIRIALVGSSDEIIEGWVRNDFVRQDGVANAGPLFDTISSAYLSSEE